MTKFRDLPIQKKLIIFVLSIIGPTLFLAGGIFVYNDLKFFKQEMVRNLTVLASAIGANSRAALIFYDENAARNILSSLETEKQIVSAALYDNSEKIFVTHVPGHVDFFRNPDSLDEGQHIFADRIEIVLPVFLEDEKIGKIYLHAHLKKFQTRAKTYIFISSLILISILFVVFVITLKLQKIISNPILSLAQTTKEISKTSNYSVRVQHSGKDEIGTLYSGFNEMLSQIEKRENKLATYRDNLQKKIVECSIAGEELKKSEETTRTILDHAFDAIITMDTNGMIVDWNQRAATIFGWHLNEAKGKNLADLIIPNQYRKSHRQGLARYLATGENEILNQQIEISGLHRNGHTIPIEIAISATKTEDIYIFTGIIRDITDRKISEGELITSRERLRNLSNKLQSAREEEKTRIAREIHDELGQALTALKFDVSWVEKKLPSGDFKVIERMREMTDRIEDTIGIVRRIASELRPQMLDILGLCETLKWQTKEFVKRTGIQCELVVEPDQIEVDPDRSTALFRVFQEALTNVARHAKADRVQTSFKKSENTLTLVVKDNGIGMDEYLVDNPHSLGLIGIKERVLVWGGKISIYSQIGHGTCLTVSMPVGERDSHGK